MKKRFLFSSKGFLITFRYFTEELPIRLSVFSRRVRCIISDYLVIVVIWYSATDKVFYNNWPAFDENGDHGIIRNLKSSLHWPSVRYKSRSAVNVTMKLIIVPAKEFYQTIKEATTHRLIKLGSRFENFRKHKQQGNISSFFFK